MAKLKNQGQRPIARRFRTCICLTEQHTGWVVPLAALDCWFSVHTSLRLIQQCRVSYDVDRWLWLAAAGFSGGAGVWSTHFIGMLGYQPVMDLARNATIGFEALHR